MKKEIKDAIVIGGALFAMFFGAGNLIFPPMIGLLGGDRWILSLLGFLVTGIGLPVLGVLAVSKAGGTISDLANKVSSKFSLVLGTVIILAIGPLLAIPRTGATVYEIGFKQLLPVHPLVISVLYFSITLFFVIKPSGIIDKIGKILTPILLVVIGSIIVIGIVDPIAVPVTTSLTNPFSDGFLQGYQTMDALGSIVMGGIILSALIEKGYSKRKDQMKLTTIAGLLAGSMLTLVYGGLLFLGSGMSAVVSSDIAKTDLILLITNNLLGSYGQIVMSVAVSAACLTTSIGLTSIVGSYFEKISNGKLSYRNVVISTCVFSSIMAVVGVESIVKIAVPLLVLVYPVAIILILFNLVDELIPHDFAYKGAMVGALTISSLDSLKAIEVTVVQNLVTTLNPVYSLVERLPLASIGFAWVIPTLIVSALACAYGLMSKGKNNKVSAELI